MPEWGPLGSVRGALSNERPYRDLRAGAFSRLIAAGSGTITAVVTLAAVHTPDGLPVTAIVAAVIGAAVTILGLLLALGAASRLGRSTQTAVTRFPSGIIHTSG